jgi:hypothetical protein
MVYGRLFGGTSNVGTWGAGLYEDDTAADLKEAITLVARVPVPGAKLLQILREMKDVCGLDSLEDQTFWLVLADQFEKRRIACPDVATNALSLIGYKNLECLKERGFDADFLAKRSKVLAELSARLRSPRPAKPRITPRNPPKVFLEPGEIYLFPAMDGYPCRPSQNKPFVTNGWGTLVVLATGRAFDWLPWCALASVATDPALRPTMQAALSERLIFHLQTNGAARCVPSHSDIRSMGLEVIGRVELDAIKVAAVLSKWTVPMAMECGWSISYAGFTREVQGLPMGCHLSELLQNAS